jgi:N-acetylmuramoyl-L-alanine amidase
VAVKPCFGGRMRRALVTIVALSASALCAWVAAPALSLRPYSSGGVDFEATLPPAQPLSGAGGVAAARTGGRDPTARWVTPPVRAPHRFDLVGVARELRELEIRVRDVGGPWSEWVEQDDATPIWVDGADEAQVRAPFKPRGSLHFVNVSGDGGSTVENLLHGVRAAINSAFISAARSFVADAAAPKPKMVGRAAWGADLPEGGCPPQAPPEYGEVRAAVIHHTVNANDYSRDQAAGIVLGICRFHVYGNGWNDIGYQALVDRFGRIYKGRAGGIGSAVVGAQAQGFNAQTTAIASIGTNDTVKLNRKARAAVVRYLAWKLGRHRAVPATGSAELTSGGGPLSRIPAGTAVTLPRVIGHRDLGLTDCPGDALYAQIISIRKYTQKRIKRYAKRHPGRPGKPGRNPPTASRPARR